MGYELEEDFSDFMDEKKRELANEYEDFDEDEEVELI